MPKIRDTATNEVIDVAAAPTWVAGMWECGDQRFTDAAGDLYEPVPDAVAPPRVSPIEFKLLWRSAERVALERYRRGTDPASADTRDAVNDFFDLLEDPRLTFVDLGLASTRDGVESVLQLLAAMGVVLDAAARKAEILSGVVQ